MAKTAKLYCMVLPGHTCPYGLKSKWLLENNGYTVEDHPLTTRDETDAFKAEHKATTTPQAWVGGGSNVPLGFVSLTENLFMVCMAVWMLVKSASL